MCLPSLRGRASDPERVSHLFERSPLVIAHRGGAGAAPENTGAAFEVAASLGVPFELDITRCASGELVVIHDDTLDRTTDGSGPVADVDLARLKTLDAGAHFGPAFAGERILTLDEVFERFGHRVAIDVEVKSVKGSDDAGLARQLARLVERHGLTDRVFVTSFSPYLLEALRRENPAIARGQLYGTFADSDLAAHERFALRHRLLNRRARPGLLAVEHTLVSSRRAVRRLQRRGYRVLAWTVNTPTELRTVLSAGVDGVITDYPERALTIAGELPARG
jgi:glycerophosphoryl diester phosphodiesterase